MCSVELEFVSFCKCGIEYPSKKVMPFLALLFMKSIYSLNDQTNRVIRAAYILLYQFTKKLCLIPVK